VQRKTAVKPNNRHLSSPIIFSNAEFLKTLICTQQAQLKIETPPTLPYPPTPLKIIKPK